MHSMQHALELYACASVYQHYRWLFFFSLFFTVLHSVTRRNFCSILFFCSFLRSSFYCRFFMPFSFNRMQLKDRIEKREWKKEQNKLLVNSLTILLWTNKPTNESTKRIQWMQQIEKNWEKCWVWISLNVFVPFICVYLMPF